MKQALFLVVDCNRNGEVMHLIKKTKQPKSGCFVDV